MAEKKTVTFSEEVSVQSEKSRELPSEELQNSTEINVQDVPPPPPPQSTLKVCKEDFEKTYKELMKESQRLQNKANDLHEEIDALVAKAQQTKNDVCLFDLPKEEENAIKADLGTVLKAWRPSAGGWFVRLILGNINVKFTSRQDKIRLKTEYEKFKKNGNIVFFVLLVLSFVVLKYLFPRIPAFSKFTMLCTEIFALCYYASLLIREHILVANGSRIKIWWLIHHYVSILSCVVVMLWEEGKFRIDFQKQFALFLIFSTGVQHLLSRYQIHRLYHLISLGTAGALDVCPETELAHRKGEDFCKSPWYLLPLIVTVQLLQLSISYSLALFCYLRKTYTWEIITLAVCFFILGVGNFLTTTLSFYEKWRIRKRKDKKVEFDNFLKKKSETFLKDGNKVKENENENKSFAETLIKKNC